jgi:hypothetical protein
VDLSCSLSPLIYAKLYHRLLTDRDKRSSTEQRLELLARDMEWLAELQRLYETYWRWQVENEARGDPAELSGVSPRHAQLATWFAAPLRIHGPSTEFTAELVCSVIESAKQDFPEMGRPPTPLRVAVVAWTLGQVCGDLDRSVPIVPAEMPNDDNIALAYSGLLEHVADLPRSESHLWPEMIGSAIVWRIAGIADGLRPQPRPDLAASINALMAEVRNLMPGPLRADLYDEWMDFRLMRNGFTHVAKAEDGYGFSEVFERARKAEDVRLFLNAVTHFICSEVSQALATSTLCSAETRWLKRS